MGKFVTQIQGNIDEFTRYMEQAMLREKLFSEIRHQFRTKINGVRCCVQTFERYSFRGGNWLTMNVTSLEYAGMLKIVVMVSGGSNNVLFKYWSFGVESEARVLEEAKRIIAAYRPIRLA